MTDKAITSFSIPSLHLFKQGKVRDVYSLKDGLLFIATDRISAFDAVLPVGIPDKGRVLSSLSVHWFSLTDQIVENHLITSNVADMPLPEDADRSDLVDRSMYVEKVDVIPFECVVRGYLVGSAWREYQRSGSVCDIPLPSGMQVADKLPEPLFTPSTKAEHGHDINISFDYMANELGRDLAEKVKSISLHLFQFASDYSNERDIILVDTKFEFGLKDQKPILIDEIFTPDSSRFWKKVNYKPGSQQDGLDKEFVRDFLRQQNWTGDGPPPELPQDIIDRTQRRYLEVFTLLTGKQLQ